MELFPIAKIACTKSVPLLKRRQDVSLNLPCSTASLLLQSTNSQQVCCQWSKTRLCTSHDFLPFQLRNKIPKQTAHKTNYVRPSAKVYMSTPCLSEKIHKKIILTTTLFFYFLHYMYNYYYLMSTKCRS